MPRKGQKLENPRRCTEAEMITRITEVHRLLIAGHTYSEIINETKKWGVQPRQIDDYIKYAKNAIKEINDLEREDALALVKTNLWDLYRRTHGNHEFGECRKILWDIAKLCGLDEIKIQHSGDPERPVEHRLQPMDLKDRVEQLKGKSK